MRCLVNAIVFTSASVGEFAPDERRLRRRTWAYTPVSLLWTDSAIGTTSVAFRRFIAWFAFEGPNREERREGDLPPPESDDSPSSTATPPNIRSRSCHSARTLPPAMSMSSSSSSPLSSLPGEDPSETPPGAAAVVASDDVRHELGAFGESVISTSRSMTVPGAQRHAGL